MEENPSGRDIGTMHTKISPGHDYEYDEAHDALAQPFGETRAPHRVDAPMLNLDEGGDYGYDEAHDFGTP
jgi:hypothetical protein